MDTKRFIGALMGGMLYFLQQSKTGKNGYAGRKVSTEIVIFVDDIGAVRRVTLLEPFHVPSARHEYQRTPRVLQIFTGDPGGTVDGEIVDSGDTAGTYEIALINAQHKQ